MYIHKIFRLWNRTSIDVSIIIETKIKPYKRKEYVKRVLAKIPFIKEIGYAGFNNRKTLESFLRWEIYGRNKGIRDLYYKHYLDGFSGFLLREVRKIIKLGLSYLRFDGTIYLFIFPTFDSFLIKRMNGIGGFTPWKNTIIINFFPGREWKRTFRETVVHELVHAISLNYTNRLNLGDDLVYEGIAEHFREHLIGGKKSDWTKSISRKQAIAIYSNIKNKLGSNDEKLYRELFYGVEKYPLWAGYAIGYYLIESYLKKQRKIDWNNLIKIPSKQIIEGVEMR